MREARFLLLFVALAVAHTWPLASDLGALSRHDNADALLNEWILGWVAHALATDPRHLFDANIFFPERHTLAFSEHLLAQSALTAPLIWSGVPTLVAHNVALIAGLALTAWTMALVVSRWTGDRWAGVLAGCLLAFNASTLTRLAHLQALHVEFLPLALLALDRLLVRPQARTAVSLACWSVMQALCSGYLLIMTALSLIVAAMVRPGEWLPRRHRRAAWLMGAAAVGGAVMLAPTLWPYREVRHELGLVRPLAEVALYSATPSSYLSTGGRVHQALWAERFFGADSLFPGLVGVGLTVVALWTGAAWRDARARMCLAIGIAGVLLSFGPRLPLYTVVYHAVPPLQGLRGAARFGFLGLVAVAALGGFGLARARRWADARGSGAAAVLSVLAIAGVNVEAWRAPIVWTPALKVSPVYTALAHEQPGAVVELPFPSPRHTDANAPFVLASTRYFRPLMNGYSGFVPASYAEHAARLAHFPDEASHRFLREVGVTHVVVHGSADDPLWARAAATPWLALRAQSPGIALYHVLP